MRIDILNKYNDGYSIAEAAKALGVNVNTAKMMLWKSGLARSHGQTKRIQANRDGHIKLDFSKNSPELAWFTGVVFGDGSLAKGFVKVTQGKNGLIDCLNNVVGSGVVIEKKSSLGKSQEVTFNSMNMYEYFSGLLDVSKRKSDQIYCPFVGPIEKYFWRGIIDTDGSICSYRFSWGSGIRLQVDSVSLKLMQDFELFCSNVIPNFKNKKIRSNRSKISTVDCYRYKLGHRESVILLKEIYGDSVGMRNEHKYNACSGFIVG
jgi:hypothetical protein